MLFISLKLLLPSFLGAIGQEILHWYHLSKVLGDGVKLFTSKSYWIITIASILFFGLTANYLSDFISIQTISKSTQLFIIGLFYPFIVKQILRILTNSFNPPDDTDSNQQIKELDTIHKFNFSEYLK